MSYKALVRQRHKYPHLFVPDNGSIKLRPVATRSQPYADTSGDGLSDGTETNVTYTTLHTATENITSLQLAFGNFYPTIAPSTEVAGPNAFDLRFSVQPLSSNYRVGGRMRGKETYTLQPDELMISDELKINIPEGTSFYIHTNVQVDTLGKKWPVGITTYPASGEGKTTGDITRGGTVTTAFLFAYSPMAILAKSTKKSVLLAGDSNLFGQGDTVNDRGFGKLALANYNIPYLNIAKPGDRAQWFKTAASRRNRIALAPFCDTILFHYGTNDIYQTNNTAAQVESDLQELFYIASSIGLDVFSTTILPCAAGTWTQTKEAVRVTVNDWLRAGNIPGLKGVIDVADMVETSRNSGVQVPGVFIADNIHLNGTGHALVASKFPANKLIS